MSTPDGFEVGDPDGDHAAEVAPRPAAPGSPLASLRERRARAAAELWIDLEVPRLDPPVYVRFAPVPLSEITRVGRKFEKYRGPDKDLRINATLMAQACRGVWEHDDDGEAVSIDPEDRDGSWPCFDERLAGLLGEVSTTAVDVVRALYLTDGDVIATGAKLSEWSGYATDELREADLGN